MNTSEKLLSADDLIALEELDARLSLVRDLVTGVVKGYKTGLHLHGHGGMGKSFTVLKHLEAIGAPYHLYNSRMTAKGLFIALRAAPDDIHVIEDMERIVKDPDAQGVLRSALWAQPRHDRVVTWTTATDGKEQFVFRGGVILISNRPLLDVPELRALASRIEVHHFDVASSHLAALMRKLASQGYEHQGVDLTPAECFEITEYVILQCQEAGCPLDLRLQQRSFQTYLQYDAGETTCHWHDLVAASVRETVSNFKHELNRLPPKVRKEQRLSILREIQAETADGQEQLRLYEERAEASRADFYRRKAEILAEVSAAKEQHVAKHEFTSGVAPAAVGLAMNDACAVPTACQP